jgi:hypothetical protein
VCLGLSYVGLLTNEGRRSGVGPVKGKCLKNGTDRERPTITRTGIDSRDDGTRRTWHVMWNLEGSEGINFTLVRFLDMNYGRWMAVDAFQRHGGLNQCLKKRLDTPARFEASWCDRDA